MSRLRIAGTSLIFISLGWATFATAINYWYYLHVINKSGESIGYVHMGLWKKCVQVLDGGTKCVTWDNLKKKADNTLDTSGFIMCQVVMIIGVLFNAVAMAIAVITMIKLWSAKHLYVPTTISGGCYLATLIVFSLTYHTGLNTAEMNGGLHVGFGFVVVSLVATLVGSLLHVIASVKQETFAYQRL